MCNLGYPSFLIRQSRVDICHNVSTVEGDDDDDDDDDDDEDETMENSTISNATCQTCLSDFSHVAT